MYHSICFRREIRKISTNFGKKSALTGAIKVGEVMYIHEV